MKTKCVYCDSKDEIEFVTILYWRDVPLCLDCRQRCVDNRTIPHLTYDKVYEG
jgi:hypothetical protein